MKALYKLLFVASVLLCAVSKLSAQTFPAGFQATKVAEGLNPTDMKFSPDGKYLFITDKTGKVDLVENDDLRETPILDISSVVDVEGERGLVHLAIDPDFNNNKYVYIYYTLLANASNRISRFTFNTATYKLENEFILTTLQPMTGSIHTGGSMNFGKDGKLYISTGESSHPEWAQDFYSNLGKVLRMNKDGTIPLDNPFYNDLTGDARYVYALGFRNPFGGDIHPITGQYFVCDVGQDRWEEINDVKAGKNYGWATVEGPLQPGTTPPDNYVAPAWYYSHDTGCAVVGGVFYAPNNPIFPAKYLNVFFYGDYCNQKIKMLDPETYEHLGTFGSNLKRPVAFAVKPSGELYYLDRGGLPQTGEEDVDGILWKVTYTGSLAPVIGSDPQTTIVSVGDSAVFSVLANGLSLSYEWLRNGTPIPNTDTTVLVLKNVALSDSGTLISCRVTNSHGTATSGTAVLRVTSRQAPVPVIDAPAEGATYVANSSMAFSGHATDAVDGTLASNKLTWKIDFHHDTHYHPGLESTRGDLVTGTYFIPGNIEVSDTVWYRIYLTAQNSLGLKKTVYREVQPQKVILHIKSLTSNRAAGIPLNLDGTITNAPVDKPSVKGVIRTITAQATYMVQDTLFRFTGWGNGSTNPALTIRTPNADTTITALYEKVASFTGEGLKGEYRTNTELFTGTVTHTRVDPQINFSWDNSPAPGVGTENFTVLWTGYIQPRTSGTYTIFFNSSLCKAKLFLNDQPTPFINRWDAGSPVGDSKTINFTAGTKYKVRIEYWANFGPTSSVSLLWSGPQVFKQVIPASSMYTLESALPVLFTDFTVKPRNEQLQLSWKIQDLGNVKGYAVERRETGAPDFETIGYINANNNNTQYTYNDAMVSQNIAYEYRIRQEDLDGSVTYSPVRVGYLSGQAGFDFVVTPNPANINRQAQLIFTQALGEAEVFLLSPEGKTVSRRRVTTTGQTVEVPLKGIAAGTYYLKVIQGHNVIVKKLVVQ